MEAGLAPPRRCVSFAQLCALGGELLTSVAGRSVASAPTTGVGYCVLLYCVDVLPTSRYLVASCCQIPDLPLGVSKELFVPRCRRVICEVRPRFDC